MKITVETQSKVPIYEQLRNQIVCGIASKQLMPGESLPSARKLSSEIAVNFHTVNKAFALLCDEGFVVVDRRKGTVIASKIPGDQTLLSEKLKLIAADAICSGMDDMNFVSMCIQAYRTAKGENI